ncbi:2-dehydro-3-deoxygalactonokinase [Niabella sp. CC-SYL272]|uniref:2-dehydro-3-deoxygalactonokinase n=1 Tax=Niabella agricola TaxID=2891571 RepID=UPI001F351B49|nr:2-dehydro-3-deoxygalactonokinase [Niabella agricola]MCF3111171.1 2-dehydro-3-deoxygalactonokinase [Niabella agricola]
MDFFLSCDWGTSTFRLRLIQVTGLVIQATVQLAQGIAQTAAEWQQKGEAISREAYYIRFLNQQIQTLEQQLGHSLTGIPIVLSGMASSSIGVTELPYKALPFSIDGSGLIVQTIPDDRHPLLLISGACTATDVMRGEETKIVGAADALPDTEQELLLLLPGTHPKHIQVHNRMVTAFRTFMTGEVFGLLAAQSILAGSVTRNNELSDPSSHAYFMRGVHLSQTHSLLHHLFGVRTNQLLKKIPPEHNYHYLSGLLIGEELKTLLADQPVYLLGSTTHLAAYTLACETLGIKTILLPDADQALVKGQLEILKRHQMH